MAGAHPQVGEELVDLEPVGELLAAGIGDVVALPPATPPEGVRVLAGFVVDQPAAQLVKDISSSRT
jgi:hypothetical protein